MTESPARLPVVTVDEERLAAFVDARARAIIREELAAAPATGRNTALEGWATPPEAARALGKHVGRHVPLSRVQGWMAAGRVHKRPKNPNAPKQKKWEVLLQTVLAAYEDDEARARPKLVLRGG